MAAWRPNVTGVSRREVGAGVVAAAAALVVSLASVIVPNVYPLGLSADARYWFGYAPVFAAIAGLVAGAAVWRRGTSLESTPERGVLAGVAAAVGTVVLVPLLAGLYLLVFPVLLGTVAGDGWSGVLRVYPLYVRESVVVAWTVAVNWSPLVGAILVPLGALVGWAYQRRLRPRGR